MHANVRLAKMCCMNVFVIGSMRLPLGSSFGGLLRTLEILKVEFFVDVTPEFQHSVPSYLECKI